MFSHGAPVRSPCLSSSCGFDELQKRINSNMKFIHLFYRTADTTPPVGDVQLDCDTLDVTDHFCSWKFVFGKESLIFC